MHRPVVYTDRGKRRRCCALCSANNLDGLVEQLADDLLTNRRYSTLDDVPFAECWQALSREFARTAVVRLLIALTVPHRDEPRAACQREKFLHS